MVFSAIGGILGTIVLVTAAPALAEVAIKFSSFEYFWLVCLGLTCGVFIASGSQAKAAISLLIGLLAGTIGMENPAAYPRFSFGSVDLSAGIDFIPAMIGMFAIAEILRFASQSNIHLPPVYVQEGSIFAGQWVLFKKYPVAMAARFGGRHLDRRAARRRLRYRGLDQLRHVASGSPRSRRNSAPVTSRASSRAAPPTTPP